MMFLKEWFCKRPALAILSWSMPALLLAACAAPTPVPLTATSTATLLPTATPTLTLTPTSTHTPTQTSSPTPTLTPIPSATATARPSSTPSPVPPPSPTPGPTPVPGPAQVCGDLVARGTQGIFILYINPVPELVWDTVPHIFHVGICNTLPPPSVPQGRYKIVLTFPGGARGTAESSPTPAELHPGLNDVGVGPWIPGYENHLAACASKAVAETQVVYNDTPDRFFHPLSWVDGRDRVLLNIRCGGDFLVEGRHPMKLGGSFSGKAE